MSDPQLQAIPTDPRQAPLSKEAYFNSIGGKVNMRMAVGSLSPELWLTKGKSFKHPDIGLTLDATERLQLIRTFAGVYGDRDTLLRSLSSIRNMDVVQTILDVVIDDGFSASDEQPMFKVVYEDKDKGMATATKEEIEKDIKEFVKSVKLEDFISSVLEDFLLLGEYPFRVEMEEKKGITAIVDDLDPLDVAAVYKGTEQEFFVEKKKGKFWIKRSKNMFHMVLSSRKVRIKVREKDGARTIPEYFRIGRSILYPAISKLKKLQMYEMASIATYLRQILSPTLISVGVPPNANPDDVSEITKRYERIITETRVSMHGEEALDFAKIMEMVGRVHVLPNFTDGKGAITPVEANLQQPNDDQEQKMRTMIAMAVGIPPYYVSLSGETGISKVETLKIYSRYSRKLVTIQEAIEAIIRDLVLTHYKLLKGVKLDREKIVVKFKSIVNVDVLDTLEYAVAAVGVVGDISNTLDSILNNANLKVKINSKKFVELFTRLTRVLEGSAGLLEVDEMAELMPAAGAEAPGGGGAAPGGGMGGIPTPGGGGQILGAGAAEAPPGAGESPSPEEEVAPDAGAAGGEFEAPPTEIP